MQIRTYKEKTYFVVKILYMENELKTSFNIIGIIYIT